MTATLGGRHVRGVDVLLSRPVALVLPLLGETRVIPIVLMGPVVIAHTRAGSVSTAEVVGARSRTRCDENGGDHGQSRRKGDSSPSHAHVRASSCLARITTSTEAVKGAS